MQVLSSGRAAPQARVAACRAPSSQPPLLAFAVLGSKMKPLFRLATGEGLFWGRGWAAMTLPSACTNSVACDPEPQHPGHRDNRGPFPSCQPGVFLNQEPGVNLLWALAVTRRSICPFFPPAEKWQWSSIWPLRIHRSTYQVHRGGGSLKGKRGRVNLLKERLIWGKPQISGKEPHSVWGESVSPCAWACPEGL